MTLFQSSSFWPYDHRHCHSHPCCPLHVSFPTQARYFVEAFSSMPTRLDETLSHCYCLFPLASARTPFSQGLLCRCQASSFSNGAPDQSLNIGTSLFHPQSGRQPHSLPRVLGPSPFAAAGRRGFALSLLPLSPRPRLPRASAITKCPILNSTGARRRRPLLKIRTGLFALVLGTLGSSRTTPWLSPRTPRAALLMVRHSCLSLSLIAFESWSVCPLRHLHSCIYSSYTCARKEFILSFGSSGLGLLGGNT